MNTDNKFIHGMGARIIALVVGVGIGALMVGTWGEDMKTAFTSLASGKVPPVIQKQGIERITADNPGLKACLEQRVGHVNKMKEDGVIGEEQFGKFVTRAEQLCKVQNPS